MSDKIGSDKLLINEYFKDSNSDIFDQISSKLNTSTDDSTNNLTNLSNDQSISNKNIKEPVICRIFSNNGETENRSSDKLFFDMLSSTKSSSEVTDNSAVTTDVSNMFNAFDFANHELDLPITDDTISDELFIKGANHRILCNSAESDRRRDAWIPSNRTRQALITAATSPPGSYIPDRDLLTMPGVVLQEDMVDNVYQVVNHYLGETEALQRKVLTLNDVTHDERGLRELIQAECYRAAVNLTSRLLTMYGQGIGKAGFTSKHTLHSVQLWFTRIALLVKLRSWSVAWAEAEAWWDLDKPDLYFQFYSELYGGRPGTLVPFSFRLLLAELPHYVHKSQEALKRLFSVLSVVRKILKNLEAGLSEDGSHFEINDSDRKESKILWETREMRILHSVINIAFQQQDYKLAVDILNGLIVNPRCDCTVYEKRALISSLARIYLQLGNVKMARHYFEKSNGLKNSGDGKNLDQQELINLGLLAVAESDYKKGFEYFNEITKMDPSNIMAANNTAVCLLYQGKQKEAIRVLEDVIHTNPSLALRESLLLNVCTLYELESSYSTENKYKMLKLISKHRGDSISLNCLKLQIKD